ncbi:MAG TPA: DUF6111 family protein [Stellaceae bacterium]|jgi:hypothetical protein|nr:DUF6111 family protein [Stellaceae bacterium]
MIRVALTILLPLLAPTALYFLWYYAFGRKAESSAAHRPWTWLVIAGLAAAAAVLFTVGIDAGGDRGGLYVPPHVEGGAVVPGQVVPQPGQR